MEELNLTMEQRKILLDAAKTCERNLHLRVARIFQQGKPINERTLTDWNKDVDLIIKTLEGELVAMQGDYIVKGIKGEFYPCKPDIFEQTYEKYE